MQAKCNTRGRDKTHTVCDFSAATVSANVGISRASLPGRRGDSGANAGKTAADKMRNTK